MEAVGTFILVLSFGLTSNALAIGLVLAALVYGAVSVSGAHFNPAVSLAYLLKGNISFNTFIGYFLSQLLGAFAAAGVFLMIAGTVYYAEPPASTSLYQQSAVEFVLAFILAFAYVSLLTPQMSKPLKINGLGIGLTLAGLLILGEHISGSIINPALSMGTSLVDYLAIRGQSYQYIPLYTIAPFAGAAVAGFFHRYVSDD